MYHSGGTRRRGGRFGSSHYPWRQPIEEYPDPKLGRHLQSFAPGDFIEEATNFKDNAVIQGCELISSYNWLDSPSPSILIPGKPPQWTPLSGTQKLPWDSGTFYRDRNASRFPSHPMEPAALSVLESEPRVVSSADIFACGSSLGNLLRFLRGTARDLKKFRILVEKVNDTIFFIRRENHPLETIQNIKGCGHTFPHAYTTWESNLQSSTSHQRILKYRFAGLNCLVRFECDGFLPTQADRDGDKQKKPVDHAGVEMGASVQELEAVLSSAKISESSPASIGKVADTVNIEYGGTEVPQSQVFDLKTRSFRKKNDDVVSQEIMRLWVCQIPNFILAFHTDGVFEEEDISVRNVKAEVDRWERDNDELLARLAALMHKIVELTNDRPEGKLELCHMVGGGSSRVLQVREQLEDAGTVLSPDTASLWNYSALFDGPEGEHEGRGEYKLACPTYHRDHGDQDGEDNQSFSDIEYDDEDLNFQDWTACGVECGYCGHCKY